MLDRPDTPWYPGMRLFRAPAPRAWREVAADDGGGTAVNDGLPLADAFAAAVGHQQAGRLGEAERVLQLILAVAPAHPETLYFLGLVESEQNGSRRPPGISRQRSRSPRTIRCSPTTSTRSIVGSAAPTMRSARCGGAIAAHPDEAMMRANLAAIHHDRLELARARVAARAAIAMQPDLPEAHFALAESLLLGGDLLGGFREYEWRWRIAKAGRLMTPTGLAEWDGTARGRLPAARRRPGVRRRHHVRRYLPKLSARCPDIVMACAEELHGLIAQIAPQIALCGRWDARPARGLLPALQPAAPLPHAPRDDPEPGALPHRPAPGRCRPRPGICGSAWSGPARRAPQRPQPLDPLRRAGAAAGARRRDLRLAPERRRAGRSVPPYRRRTDRRCRPPACAISRKPRR